MKLIKEISKKFDQSKIFYKIEGDYIITRRTKVRVVNLNEDLAYLTGVIAGDGTLIKAKRRRGGYHYEVRVYGNSQDYLGYINRLIKDLFRYSGKVIKDKRKKQTYILNIRNAVIFHYFTLLDAKFVSNNLSPFIKSNKKFLVNYIAGLIDTDGSISHRRIQLKLKNKKFIKNLYKKLLEIRANPNPPKINYTNSIPFYYLRFDNIFPLRLK